MRNNNGLWIFGDNNCEWFDLAAYHVYKTITDDQVSHKSLPHESINHVHASPNGRKRQTERERDGERDRLREKQGERHIIRDNEIDLDFRETHMFVRFT